MTIRLCHSEGAFCDWRIFPFSKTLKFLAERKDSLSKQKRLFCRNDNTSLSFWRSFLRLKNLSFFENIKVPCWKKKIAHRRKNGFSVGRTKIFLTEEKQLLFRNDNTSLSFWRSFLRLKNLSFFENIQIPRQSKNSFSVGMTICICPFEEAFCNWRIFPSSKTYRFLVKAKTAFLSEWQKDSSSKKKRLLCRNDKKIPHRRKNSFSFEMTTRICPFEGAFCDWRIFPVQRQLNSIVQKLPLWINVIFDYFHLGHIFYLACRNQAKAPLVSSFQLALLSIYESRAILEICNVMLNACKTWI
jgi:hypothetical protein